MRKSVIFLLVLSFLMPSIHFISHKHNYNPFTKKLEHSHENLEISNNAFVTLEATNKTFISEDNCDVKIINEVQINNFKIKYTSLNYKNNYFYNKSYNSRIYKSKILLLAPKNSPPLA